MIHRPIERIDRIYRALSRYRVALYQLAIFTEKGSSTYFPCVTQGVTIDIMSFSDLTSRRENAKKTDRDAKFNLGTRGVSRLSF